MASLVFLGMNQHQCHGGEVTQLLLEPDTAASWRSQEQQLWASRNTTATLMLPGLPPEPALGQPLPQVPNSPTLNQTVSPGDSAEKRPSTALLSLLLLGSSGVGTVIYSLQGSAQAGASLLQQSSSQRGLHWNKHELLCSSTPAHGAFTHSTSQGWQLWGPALFHAPGHESSCSPRAEHPWQLRRHHLPRGACQEQFWAPNSLTNTEPDR